MYYPSLSLQMLTEVQLSLKSRKQCVKITIQIYMLELCFEIVPDHKKVRKQTTFSFLKLQYLSPQAFVGKNSCKPFFTSVVL